MSLLSNDFCNKASAKFLVRFFVITYINSCEFIVVYFVVCCNCVVTLFKLSKIITTIYLCKF